MTRRLSLNAPISPATTLVQDHSRQRTAPPPPPSSPHCPFSVRSLRDPTRTKILSLLCSKPSHAAHLTQSRQDPTRPHVTRAHHLANLTPPLSPSSPPLCSHRPPSCSSDALLPLGPLHWLLSLKDSSPRCLYSPLPHLLEVFAQMSLSPSITPGPY